MQPLDLSPIAGSEKAFPSTFTPPRSTPETNPATPPGYASEFAPGNLAGQGRPVPARRRGIKTHGLAGGLASGALLFLLACQGDDREGFYGAAQAEAESWKLSPSQGGLILAVYRDLGDSVEAGEVLALSDTVPIALQIEEMRAGLAEIDAQARARGEEKRAVQTEAAGLRRDLDRVESLVASGTVPGQRADDMKTGLGSARAKAAALAAGAEAVRSKEAGLRAKLRLLEEQRERCSLRAPVSGRITARYRHPGEMGFPGQPILELSRTDSLDIDFFVPQTLLGAIRLGEAVDLRLDAPDGKAVWLPATIRHIADEAEFSPKNIQTRESRNELVFWVRARAANRDGRLKRGLPLEVWKSGSARP